MSAESGLLIFDIPVTVQWAGSFWKLTYLRPCQFCHRHHTHGGNDDPDGPHLGEDVWGSHCGAPHRGPFGPDCDPKVTEARLACVANHRHMVRLHEATDLELALTPEKVS